MTPRIGPTASESDSPGTASRGGGLGPWPLRAVVGVVLVLVGGYLALRPFASLAVLLVAVCVGLLLAGVGELMESPGRIPSRWRYLRAAAYLLGAVGVIALTGLGVRAVIIAVG